MRNFLIVLKEWCEYVFPVRADYKLVENLDEDKILLYLNPINDREITSLLPFTEPSVRALVHEAKFHQNEKAWRLLGFVLAQYLKHLPKEVALVSIPLSLNRRRIRGYNQVSEILKEALKHTPHLKNQSQTLKRIKDTKPQTTLDRKDRLENVKDAFAVFKAPKEVQIIIIDDVSTTGSTLKEAKAAFNRVGKTDVTLLSLAR